MSVLIEADQLVKRFGAITAADHISLNVKKGEVLGFLGPNGAGKSTTMKILTGFLEPDSGSARICGIDVGKEPQRAKAHLGYLPEGAPLYGEMTPTSFLNFIAEIHGFDGGERDRKVGRIIERTALESVVDQTIDTLSKGYKRRVGLAQSMIHDPEVLILDEPTDGLDPNQKHHVRNMIKEMAKDKAIIVSTHILEEVEAVCTRAIVIDRGKIVADGTAEELQARLPYHNAVAIRTDEKNSKSVAKQLEGLAQVERIETVTENGTEEVSGANGSVQLRVIPKSGELIAGPVAAMIQDKSLTVQEIYVERGRLDDVFRQITTSDTEAG